jgi:hypothetical protein
MLGGSAMCAVPMSTAPAEQRAVVADAGTFALTGQAATLSFGRRMLSDVGAFALTGQAAAVQFGGRVVGAVGAYLLTGMPANVRLVISNRLRARDHSGPEIAVRDESESYW